MSLAGPLRLSMEEMLRAPQRNVHPPPVAAAAVRAEENEADAPVSMAPRYTGRRRPREEMADEAADEEKEEGVRRISERLRQQRDEMREAEEAQQAEEEEEDMDIAPLEEIDWEALQLQEDNQEAARRAQRREQARQRYGDDVLCSMPQLDPTFAEDQREMELAQEEKENQRDASDVDFCFACTFSQDQVEQEVNSDYVKMHRLIHDNYGLMSLPSLVRLVYRYYLDKLIHGVPQRKVWHMRSIARHIEEDCVTDFVALFQEIRHVRMIKDKIKQKGLVMRNKSRTKEVVSVNSTRLYLTLVDREVNLRSSLRALRTGRTLI